MFFEIGRLKPPCLLIAYFPVIVKGGAAVHFTLTIIEKDAICDFFKTHITDNVTLFLLILFEFFVSSFIIQDHS